jgi:hypothetical protein
MYGSPYSGTALGNSAELLTFPACSQQHNSHELAIEGKRWITQGQMDSVWISIYRIIQTPSVLRRAVTAISGHRLILVTPFLLASQSASCLSVSS